MDKMKINVAGRKVFVDARKWGTRPKYLDLGDYILTLLFYCNREGKLDYELIVDGVDETADFKSQVKDKYQDIPNTGLRDNFFKYANI